MSLPSVLYDRNVKVDFNGVNEVLAAHAVAAGLRTQVNLADLSGGPNAEFDLHIGPDLDGLGEVVTTRDEDRTRIFEQIRSDGTGAYQLTSLLRQRWIVFVENQAQARKVSKHIPAVLAQYEQLGLTRANAAMSPAAIAEPLRQLHVWSVVSIQGAAGFRLQARGGGGFATGGESVLLACEQFIAGPIGTRKLNKLRASGKPDCHLCIVVTPEDWPHIYGELQDPNVLPDRAPHVQGIRGLWVMPLAPSARSIFWLAEEGWSSTIVEQWTPPDWDWS